MCLESVRNLNCSVMDRLRSDLCKRPGQTSLKILGAVALAALATFGVLGLLQAHGHLSSAPSWLDSTLHAVPQPAFYSMIGASALVSLLALKVIRKKVPKSGYTKIT